MNATFRFTFERQHGLVHFADTDHERVSWAGMYFQIEAAGPELRAAIEAARGLEVGRFISHNQE
jgi:hypothetical protein